MHNGIDPLTKFGLLMNIRATLELLHTAVVKNVNHDPL